MQGSRRYKVPEKKTIPEKVEVKVDVEPSKIATDDRKTLDSLGVNKTPSEPIETINRE